MSNKKILKTLFRINAATITICIIVLGMAAYLRGVPFLDFITPFEVYIQRCKTFEENPPVAPGKKWDGVFHLTKR
ncbi:MAG: hypothetical protein KAU38_15035 [Desulfobacterales bacterium]|nr:hypothetical protein [Desulfobacterales bacterium]